jgi:glycogen debranching enzyme
MTGGWSYSGEPASVGVGAVTLVEGSSFCICAPSGDIRGSTHGVFFNDTRILSAWEIALDGAGIESLTVTVGEPWRATFISRAPPRPGRSESTVLMRAERFVGQGMREDLVLQNLSNETAAVQVLIRLDSDFADLFEVKEGRVPDRPRPTRSVLNSALLLERFYASGASLGVQVTGSGAGVTPSGLVFQAVVPPRGEWRTSLQVLPMIDGVVLPPRYPTDRALEETTPARQERQWRESAPVVRTDDPALGVILERSRVDLGALRIVDPDAPENVVVAAGAPWFMALFGRDSLLTSYMALPLDQSLALGTLTTLARLQGRDVDPLSEEEPGRILHEVRLGGEPSRVPGGRKIYYGTADATPLFVLLLGELRRWGLASEEVDTLLPSADRALAWIRSYGDRDGDGFVEYQRSTDRGLVNQGWKDSWDGINFADGTLPRGPIALSEVQAYVYSAFLARSHFAWESGDEEERRAWSDRASALKADFNERFWLPDRGWYAVALDGEKRPVDALASNMGHCLWTGIVDEDKAPQVAEHLLSDEMFSGWGVRTLATSMGAYNPLSYHNGSVWPHDNALVAAGLMRYGFVEHAQRIALGLFDAAEAFGGRLPELFCGFSREDYPLPVPFPTSCSPQAWAAATPVQLLRTLLRFDPWVPRGKAWLAPALPPRLATIGFDHLPLGESRLSLDVSGNEVTRLTGLPPGLQVLHEPRPPSTAVTGVPASG